MIHNSNLHQDFSSLLNNNNELDALGVHAFQQHIYAVYSTHKRTFPWRDIDSPYHIVVSEIMLQQTQVQRVVPFYERFVATFPNFHALAQASLRDVLTVWSGLGYNRRAVALHQLSETVVHTYGGILPNTIEQLQQLPGIGPNTAGSVVAFAFNQPTVFIETNIRTVFLHTFFREQTHVHDKKLIPLIAKTIDVTNPRDWYYALMDYGSLLKQHIPNPNRKSKHYTVQSNFIGSDRRVRGAVIRQLTQMREIPYEQLTAMLIHSETGVTTSRAQLEKVLEQLCNERMITNTNGVLSIFSK